MCSPSRRHRSRALIGAAFSLLWSTLGFAEARILYVDDDAPLGGNGMSWNTPFRYLQDALWIAAAGDEIRVAGGVYKPDHDEAGKVKPGDRGASFRLTTELKLAGGHAGLADPANPDRRDLQRYESTLSGDLEGDDEPGFVNNGDNSANVVYIPDATENLILDGFTVRGGNGGGWLGGGGILFDAMNYGTATVKNCRFLWNSSDGFGGGAILAWSVFGSSLTLVNCRFSENRTTNLGGALAVLRSARATVADCEFAGNLARQGGAIALSGNPSTLARCTFRDNRAGNGGALLLASWSTLLRCTFEANIADETGGAIQLNFLVVTCLNARFLRNQAGIRGGAIAAAGYRYAGAEVVFANCELSGNTSGGDGGAVSIEPPPGYQAKVKFVGCSLSQNVAAASTGGMRNVGLTVTTIVDSILWGNRDSSGSGESAQLSKDSQATLAIDYSCVQGWTGQFGGVGNHAKDPRFLDPLGPDGIPGTPDDDLRLNHRSPCIDAADNTAVPPDTYDLDGDGDLLEPLPLDLAEYNRFRDDPYTPDTGRGTPPIVDMGAYEFRPLGDLNCDGGVNNFDIDPFVLALTDPAGYKAKYPACDSANADINGDHAVNNFDIEPFVKLLLRR